MFEIRLLDEVVGIFVTECQVVGKGLQGLGMGKQYFFKNLVIGVCSLSLAMRTSQLNNQR